MPITTVWAQEGARPDATSGSATVAAAKMGDPAAAQDAWTPASYINSRLPHWLRLSGQFRNRDEAPTAYSLKPGNNDAYALTRTVLNLDAAPANWFHAFVQARDAEVMGANPRDVDRVDEGCVRPRSRRTLNFAVAGHGWFSLQVGRQQLRFGDERLVGRSDWSNASRSFDAIRLSLQSQGSGVHFSTLLPPRSSRTTPPASTRCFPGRTFMVRN